MAHIDLHQLSRIGLGTYHMSVNDPAHCKAFDHAMRSGCNVVDTAVNYEQGGAEEMIGRWMGEHPGFPCFIVSKAGYVNKKDLPFLKKLEDTHPGPVPLVSQVNATHHCIHPDYLAKKIRLSLKRLQRKSLDGFLLHNPEYFLLSRTGEERHDVFYQRIKEAFSFLEECVRKRIIRYYGVSSNTMGLMGNAGAVDPLRLIAAAKEVSADNHFKLLQFPFNFSENALLEKRYKGNNLLQLAHTHGLRTFSNRPLNMHAKNGFIRFAVYAEPLSASEEQEANNVFDVFIEMVDRKLLQLNAGCTAFDLEVITQFRDHWKRMGNHAAVAALFRDFLQPLLDTLFDGENMSEEESKLMSSLRGWCYRYADITMSVHCREYVKELRKQGILDTNDKRPLPVQACSAYLRYGIDHVLVGMRQTKYVDELKAFFVAERPALLTTE